MKIAVGIDFGATSTKMGLINESGQLLDVHKFTTGEKCDPDTWLNEIAEGLAALRKKRPADAPWAGIGIGVPGFTDFEKGLVHALPNVAGWTRVPLAQRIRDRFSMQAFVENDANAMAFGEVCFGAGRAYHDAVFLTLGTGVGGGIVINGKVHRGAYSMAGEIGHISIDMNGTDAPPLGRGGLEEYIGNRQIAEYASRLLAQGRSSIIPDVAREFDEDINPHVIGRAAERGDPLAREIYTYVADCLATALASVSYLIQPQAFIIGGGIAQAGVHLFEPLKECFRKRISPVFYERTEILPAALGNDAGMIGCGALVLKS